MTYVCRYVCGYVSTIKRKLMIGITWNSAQLWFGFRGTGSSFRTFDIPFISVERMQLERSDFLHRFTTGGCCLRNKNYAGMRRMLQKIRATYIMRYQNQKRETVFPWHFVQRLARVWCHLEQLRVGMDLHLHRVHILVVFNLEGFFSELLRVQCGLLICSVCLFEIYNRTDMVK